MGAARERGPRYMPASVRGCCMVGVGSGKLRESAGGVELRSSSMGAAAGSVGMPSLAVLHERTWEPLSGVSAL